MQAPAEVIDLPSVTAQPEASRWQSLSFPFSRFWLVLTCGFLALVVGYLDYLTGYEQSLLLFYLVPIAIATWFSGFTLGLTFSIFCVIVWVCSDVFAGIASVGFWTI